MIQRFIKYVTDNDLFSLDDTILVGVSGGIDSVVLLDLLDKAGFSMVIAHCNFRLRGSESDGDERLVNDLAKKYDVPIFKTAFDTADYAQENKISIEMAARELRYQWFEMIRSTHHFECIAVAHHRDDQLETFFLNLIRGTGLTGLTGMDPVNGKVVRPLLFASREEIEIYRRENFLDYREDSSNQSLDFQRNKIRHMILPVMESLNPSFREGLIKTMYYLEDVSKIYNKAILQTWERVVLRKGNEYWISIAELKLLDPLPAYVFEFLKPYGFNSNVAADVVASLGRTSGKQFISPTHRLVRDRESLILTPLLTDTRKHFYLDEKMTELVLPVHLKILITEKTDKFKIPDSRVVACIDRDKVQFPLLIRRWKQGDYFKPLGMIGFKKISDYFIDSKLSIPDKENAWILANGEQVIWIIGHRLDDRYKITQSTQNILKLEMVARKT
jgi:tRNA(Ile)-lysidine synthase